MESAVLPLFLMILLSRPLPRPRELRPVEPKEE